MKKPKNGAKSTTDHKRRVTGRSPGNAAGRSQARPRKRGNNMKLKQVTELMYENNEAQMICMQDHDENVLYIGTVAELERQYPKSLNAEILTMFTERYPAFNNVSGLTVIVENNRQKA